MFTNSLKGGGVGEVIQTNRVPLTLIGIGVAWLVASNTGLVERVVNDERVQAAQRRIGELAGDIGIGGGSSERIPCARFGAQRRAVDPQRVRAVAMVGFIRRPERRAAPSARFAMPAAPCSTGPALRAIWPTGPVVR